MIRKLLLIGESGLLPFYLSQDDIRIDPDLLSGFCRAIHGFSLELTFPLKHIGFEKHKMLVESINHSSNKQMLIAVLFDEYHIEQGIINKINFIFDKFFQNFKFENEGICINNDSLDSEIKGVINDVALKIFITHHIKEIKEILDPILEEKDNGIFAYSLNSSTNNILYLNCTGEIFKHRLGGSLRELVKEYLLLWNNEKIPQSDNFFGLDLPTGLDLIDYYETGQKTLGIVINTSINLKEEPCNELLLYFFGKNMLMRSCVPDIEEILRRNLIKPKEIVFPFEKN